MADEAAVVDEGLSPAQSPLVSITFQRNVRRKEKYLEAEPKALGITQIGLSTFQILSVSVFLAKGLSHGQIDIPFLISSVLVVIAGSVAVAAQNLHLPTLRACLGMQILACVASLFNFICTLLKIHEVAFYCWHYYDDDSKSDIVQVCHKIENTKSHFYAESMVIQAALFAISATLAAYSSKVINCCAPAPKMPVITVQVPPSNDEEDRSGAEDGCTVTQVLQS